VHSANGWRGVLEPVVLRYQGEVARLYFRADAAFAMPEVYEFLEAEDMKYTIPCRPPTTHHIAGSRRNRSPSFTSS
jgi:hypothetical protein